MTQDEALKLALEFIERVNKDGWILADFEPEMYATITAIKKALAQPQRTWQGLTNNDLQPIAEEYRILFGSWVHDFARAIEAKLKEKNGA